MVFSTKEWFWCKTNAFIQFRIMKNPSFDSTQGKVKLFNFRDTVLGTHIPAAVMGSPTGVEFKLFEMCYQTPLQIHW